MSEATLTISSRNYSSWSLRGWLMTRLSGLAFDVEQVSIEDPSVRSELLLLSPSILVPCLTHGGVKVWDTLAIGEYLHELRPDAGLLPEDRAARARCRSISGEMHSGFSSLRSALPMNLKAHFPGFKVWARAQGDIARIRSIWEDCLATWGGPYLFGRKPCMADVMYAPVATRLLTYDVRVDGPAAAWCSTILGLPELREWIDAAQQEPDEIDEFEVEF